jgi:hypothetical protein
MKYDIIEIGQNFNSSMMIDTSFKLLKIEDCFEFNYLSEIALKYEPSILELPIHKMNGNENLYNTTTSRHFLYNVLNYPEMNFFKEILKKAASIYYHIYNQDFQPFGATGWFNVLRDEININNHNHLFYRENEVDHLFAINCCIQCNETYTVFFDPYTKKTHKIKNKNGEIYIFPSWVTHKTEKTNGTRITMAFDCSRDPKKFLDNRQWEWIK